MSDTHVAPGSGAEAIVSVPVTTPAVADNSPISATEAARQLAAFRWKRDNPEAAKPEPASAEPAAQPTELAETPTDAQAQPDPVETTETPDPALPSIEPPRSWTKEEKEEFLTYPREAQEKIARREQERDAAIRRSQNEAAEQRKAIEAEKVQAEKVRQEYEAKLPALLQTLQEAQAGQFADIKTQADVVKLAQDDPFRYLQWDAHQKQVAAIHQQASEAQQRQAQEWQQQWSKFAEREDKLTAERIPELADPVQKQKVQEGAITYLKEIGFQESELASAWNGQASLSLRDHRVQGLIRDAVKYREAKAGIAKAPPKPVPTVQKPGVARAPANAQAAEIEALEAKFAKTGNPKDGAALLNARRRATA